MTQTISPQAENQGYAKPIYIFAAVLLSGVTLTALPELEPATAVILFILAAAHLLLHWLCPRWAKPGSAWLVYTLTQTAIVSGLTLVSGSAALWGVALTWLIAEAVGFQANGRLLLLTIVIYAAAGVVTLLAAFGQATTLEWLEAILPTAVFIGIIVYLYKQQVAATEKSQQLVADLETANRQISDYAAQVEALTISQERQRIARELHDTLAQGLAGLVLQLEAANAHLNNGRVDRAQSIIQATMGKTRTTLADARAVIDDLRAQEPGHLSQQIENLCHEFEAASGISCQITIDLGIWQTQIPVEQQEQIERIVAEALTNIRRHAQATAVSVSCVVEAGTLTLTIRDNGRGFDPDLVPKQGHYGLRGLRERARILQAALQIQSSPGSGTLISLKMSLTDDTIKTIDKI